MTNRTILFGDLHGCWAELEQLLDQLSVTSTDRLVSVGDLVDRGPDSVRLWDFFRTRPNSLVLMGNHERKHVRGILSYSQEIVRLQFGDRYEAFRAWAAELPYFLETPELVAVHGGFEDGVPLSEQREDVLSATTSGTQHLERLYGDRYWPDVYSGQKPVVFGHHIVGDRARVFGGRVYGLDTGACHGGWLTALVVPGFTLHRVKAARDYWREARSKWQVPVLAARPWASWRFPKIERELEELRRARSPEVGRFRADLEAWLAGLDASVPSLVTRVNARAAELSSRFADKALKKAAASEPHPALVFSALAGSLDPATVRATLTTPAALADALRRHALTVPVDPTNR